MTSSVTALRILRPVALLMSQVSLAFRQDQLLPVAQGLAKHPKLMWSALQQHLNPHCIPGLSHREGLGGKMTEAPPS